MDELRILVPLTDDAGGILHQQGPSDRAYPVLREPVADSAVGRIVDAEAQAHHWPAARALRMEAESLGDAERSRRTGQAGRFRRFRLGVSTCPASSAPHSSSCLAEGGFVRVGFWLDTDGERTFVPSGYVEMVVDEASSKTTASSALSATRWAVIIRNLVPSFADRPRLYQDAYEHDGH